MNIISISGTHCNGKSSIFNEFKEELSKDSRFLFFGGPTRLLKEEGLPINQSETESYDETQYRCLTYDLDVLKQVSLLPKDKIVITERCILDTYIYTKYLYEKGKVSKTCFDLVKKSYLLHRGDYKVFYIPTHQELKYEKDGIRDGDIEFREDIYKLFYDEYYGPQFHWYTGTMYSRMGHIYQLVKFHFKVKLNTMRSQDYYLEKYPKSNLIQREGVPKIFR